MKALLAFLAALDEREKELAFGLIQSPPQDYAAFQNVIGRAQEIGRIREEARAIFRLKEDEDE